MIYTIKEIYYTIQGEGSHTGRAAIFCRFAGCNLWSGREADRAMAICQFCDTNFIGIDGVNGGKYQTPEDLVSVIAKLWPREKSHKFIVLTGGEPLLQLDKPLIDELKNHNFEVAIETNGTIQPPEGLDWICVSPKAGAALILKKGSELKLVYPQKNMDPKDFEALEFANFYIQPMDGKELNDNINKAIQFCLSNPKWKLSIQTHKILNIP